MGDASAEMSFSTPHVSFRSKELELLLDMIDELRAQGISRFIDLPQMIVCGDQSSGKSSVLEAVSGVRFPTKDNLCTRFPTELILRRSPESSTSISIVPDATRDEKEKAQLEAFRAGEEALEDFGSIVDAAGKEMGLDKNSKVFSNDVLRVELTGPKLPHLTLVDLPGLFHSGNKNQSANDAEAVKKLVTSYMQKSRSVILAVVSAKNDYANQIVTQYARDIDPSGDRTLGVITKPDTLHAGSESEQQFFELAENKDVVLRLGWHVLKNRDFDTKDYSAEERDQSEELFFSKRIWTSLSPSQLGIGSLKSRLGRVLRDQILKELPGLIKDVEAGIKDCEARLNRLGGSRATKHEQRVYLHQISQAFCKIVRDSVNGYYTEAYFDDSLSTGYPKRIRAVVANLLDDFESKMRKNGKHFCIVEDTPNEVQKGADFPVQVTREDRIARIATLMKENRGQELPGFVKFDTVTTLFREECQPWKDIIETATQGIYDAVRTALHLALNHVADQSTKDGVLRFLINPALDATKSSLDSMVAHNLHQHVKGHPITLNHYFTDNVQKLRNEHLAKFLESKLRIYVDGYGHSNTSVIPRDIVIKDLVTAMTNHTLTDMVEFACSEALHYTDAYYKVALKFFIDDFSIHTIEQGLLERLSTIFDPEKVLTLNEEDIEDIAGEGEESRAERASSSTKLTALNNALKVLRQLDRGRPNK